MEGIIPLIIIGIVLNMVIKAMRAKMKQPTPRQPAPRPDLGQDVDRPFADEARPQVPHTTMQPQLAPQVSDVLPVAEKRAPYKGVSLEGTSMEGTSLETMHVSDMPGDSISDVSPLVSAGAKAAANPIAEWFRGDGVVRGIIMSEVLNPPVSRRR